MIEDKIAEEHVKLHQKLVRACDSAQIAPEIEAKCHAIIARVVGQITHTQDSQKIEAQLDGISTAMQAVGLGESLAKEMQRDMRTFAELSGITVPQR